MNSLSQRVNLGYVLMNRLFDTLVKIKDDDPMRGFVAFAFLGVMYGTRKLQMIQSAIRKPNSKKLHYTRFQRISWDILLDKVKKHRLKRRI